MIHAPDTQQAIAAAIQRNEEQAIDAALARIHPDRLARLLGAALTRRHGRLKARRLALLAADHAWETD